MYMSRIIHVDTKEFIQFKDKHIKKYNHKLLKYFKKKTE